MRVITLNIAKSFADAGYRAKVNCYYHGDVSEMAKCGPAKLPYNDYLNYWAAPTLQEATNFLREEKGVHVFVKLGDMENRWFWTIQKTGTSALNVPSCKGYFQDHDEALLEGIKKAIQIFRTP